MSSGISGGKQKIKFANARNRRRLFSFIIIFVILQAFSGHRPAQFEREARLYERGARIARPENQANDFEKV